MSSAASFQASEGRDDGSADSPNSELRLGIEVPLDDVEAEELSFHMMRIRKLQNLERCTKLKRLEFISCMIEKIENLEALKDLQCLELYQNKIKKIENLEKLHKLETLDLSFNEIRDVAGLSTLVALKELRLASNKIADVNCLAPLTNLELLELGSNRLKSFFADDERLVFPHLKELWLGRNKIADLQLPSLPSLEILSLQANRLSAWPVPSSSSNLAFHSRKGKGLRELYLSENALPDPPEDLAAGLKDSLKLLDLAQNQVSSLKTISELYMLEELWLNKNMIRSLDEVKHLQKLPNLRTLYLEHNPIHDDLGVSYRSNILKILPQLTQLDALPIP